MKARVWWVTVAGRSRVRLLAALLLAGTACGQATPRAETRFDTALVNEQRRRIAAFDSVVRSINTDSVYKLWHWSLTLPDPKVGAQQVECEVDRIGYRYGVPATGAALRRMQDTLWRDVDPQQVARLGHGLKGESLPFERAICGPRTTAERAPYWLEKWSIYPLPQLPPSPRDSEPRHPGWEGNFKEYDADLRRRKGTEGCGR